VKRVTKLMFAVAIVFAVSAASGQNQAAWKVFSNRSGWSIRHPADWQLSSCNSCNDLHEPGGFVSFFPPKQPDSDGSVMVEQLGAKPVGTSDDAWLANIARTANLNKQVAESRMKLNGLPALKVRYRTASGGEMEAVYVLAGVETFEVSFSPFGDSPQLPLEKVGNFRKYLEMLNSFRVRHR
jgi:hypothetical protein